MSDTTVACVLPFFFFFFLISQCKKTYNGVHEHELLFLLEEVLEPLFIFCRWYHCWLNYQFHSSHSRVPNETERGVWYNALLFHLNFPFRVKACPFYFVSVTFGTVMLTNCCGLREICLYLCNKTLKILMGKKFCFGFLWYVSFISSYNRCLLFHFKFHLFPFL